MERIMLDVDLAMGVPGSDIDDGFALALALADPDIQVDLVTTVSGNTDVNTATALTMELLHKLGRTETPVHRGASRPLMRARAYEGSLPDVVTVREPRSERAAVAMIEHVQANPGEITLVAVGPLTNVALAMRLDDSFAGNLKHLVIMGGIFDAHTHRTAMPGEFNVWSDPEAAAIVLASGLRAGWVGLDVTLQVRMTRNQAKTMQASASSFESFAGLYAAAYIDSDAYQEYCGRRFGGPVDWCAMHDPLAVAAVTHPEFLTWQPAFVQIETGDKLRGAMLSDYLDSEWTPYDGDDPVGANALVARDVDAEAFNEFFASMLRRSS